MKIPTPHLHHGVVENWDFDIDMYCPACGTKGRIVWRDDLSEEAGYSHICLNCKEAFRYDPEGSEGAFNIARIRLILEEEKTIEMRGDDYRAKKGN